MRGPQKTALTGLLGALALALSFLEGLLPPLPGVPPGFKLGLSNLAVMYAAGALGLPAALFLACVKGGFAFLSRGAAAGLLSLCGGLLSAPVTWLLFRAPRRSLAQIGVGGALAHNLGQLLAALFLLGPPVLSYAPLLLLFGIASGVLTGAILRAIWPILARWGPKAP